jgi:hypothetical protein
MAGFANSPLGITPFGTGTPAVAQAPPANPPEGARYLNPATRDYERDDEGEYKRMPVTRQRVLLALTTLFNSSSVLVNQGLKLPKKMDVHFEQRVRVAVQNELAFLVSEGAMRLDGVTVERTTIGRARIKVDFTDLATRERDSVVI